jgi:hypothetical protein
MTPREEVEEFLAAMEASGFRRARELPDLLLRYCLTDNSHGHEAVDAMRAAMREKHLPLLVRAGKVAAILNNHRRAFPAEQLRTTT